MRGELEGEQGGTCHNHKPGQMMGMMMGVEERSRCEKRGVREIFFGSLLLGSSPGRSALQSA